MTFRDREKSRLVPLKPVLFPPDAIAQPGKYKGKTPYPFCLVAEHAPENLWRGCREEALAYFERRRIGWHDGSRAAPSNHLCCSQSSCVNALMPFRQSPEALAAALRALDLPVSRVLAIDADVPGRDGTPKRSATTVVSPGYVAFEWIGTRNYLGEGPRNRATADDRRRRGAQNTSADFAIRFEDFDGAVQLLLGEWKYTEAYASDRSIRYGDEDDAGVKTDRLVTYGPFLRDPDCPIRRPEMVAPEDLMFEPFDQLMRLQLLAWRMEGAELGASHATVVHVAPDENKDLMERITSKKLAQAFPAERTIHGVWSRLVPGPRFRPLSMRRLLEALVAHAPDPAWAEWMRVRYLGMA